MRKLMVASAIALMFPAMAMAMAMAKPKPQPAAEPVAAAEPAATSTPAAEPAPADAKMAIADKIKADWPKYDMGAKGYLNRGEVGKWLTDLRVAANQPVPDAEWQNSAFVQTDKNSDTKVSVEELTAFLTAGS